MINFNLPYVNDEHKSLAMLMKEFCEREVDIKTLCTMADIPIPPNATRDDLMARMPWDLVSKAHDAGLRQITIPAEYGGGGYTEDHVAQGLMAEVAGYYGGPFSRVMTVGWLGARLASYYPKHLAEEVLTDFMNDRRTMLAGSITEPNSGSDILLPYNEPGVAGAYFARRDGDDWIVNGDKMFCTAGGVSNYISLICRTDPKGPVTESMTSFAVPVKTQGWSINRVNDMICNELLANVQMRFDNVRIPDRNRVTDVNGAFRRLRSNVAGKTLHLFGLFGWAERAWEDMKEYAKARVQGGRPIIQHNNVGAMLAEGQAILQACRLLLFQDAYECTGQERFINPQGWYLCNWYFKKMVYRLIEIGMEVYGGMAPQKELTFEHFVRMCLGMFHGGSTGVLSLIKAGRMIEQGS
jgi:alkylation response protein AidB-like acyl-CoA dehydrogenase